MIFNCCYPLLLLLPLRTALECLLNIFIYLCRINACPIDAEPAQPDAVAGSCVVGGQQVAGAATISANGSEPQKLNQLQRKKAVTAGSVGGARTTRTRARLNSAANAGTEQASVTEAARAGNDMEQSMQQALREAPTNVEERTCSGTICGEGLGECPLRNQSTPSSPMVTDNPSAGTSMEVVESLVGSAEMDTIGASGIVSSAVSNKTDADLLRPATSLVLPGAEAVNAEQERHGSLSVEAYKAEAAEAQACSQEVELTAVDEAVNIPDIDCAVLQTLSSSPSVSAINISSSADKASAMNTTAEGIALITKENQANAVMDSERTFSAKHEALSAVLDVQTAVTEDQVSLLSPPVATDNVIYFGEEICAQEPSGSDQSDQSAVVIGWPVPVVPTDALGPGGESVTTGASGVANEAHSVHPVATSPSMGNYVQPPSAARSELSQTVSENFQDPSKSLLNVARVEQAEQVVTMDARKGQTVSITASRSGSEMLSFKDLDPSAQETANILTASSAFLKWKAVEGSGDGISAPEKEIVPVSVDVAAAAESPTAAPLIPVLLSNPSVIPGLEGPHAVSELVCEPYRDCAAFESSGGSSQPAKLDSDSLPAQQTGDLIVQQKLSNPAVAVAMTTRPEGDTIEPSPSAVDGTSAQTAEPPPVAA
jgi:hypothetical protein